MKNLLILFIGINIFIKTSLFCDPNTPISGSSQISIDVVKPIEILFNSNIYHSIFKGVQKNIFGEFFFEVKASPNTDLLVKYNSQILLMNQNNKIITLLLEDINNNLSSVINQDYREVLIKNSINTPKQKWFIPYKINLTGQEENGIYKGVINITVQYS